MPITSSYWSNTVTYRRQGWSDRKIDRLIKRKKVIVRRKDVGRPKHHYINMYYYTPPSPNMLVKTTFRKRINA